jgi:hypothetical protein
MDIFGVRGPKRLSIPAPVARVAVEAGVPAGSVRLPGGACILAPDPNSIAYLGALLLVRGDIDAARRGNEASRGE